MRFRPSTPDNERLHHAHRTGVAIVSNNVAGKVIELTPELATIRSVFWSGRDIRTAPLFHTRTFRRSALVDVDVAPAKRPIKLIRGIPT